MIRTTTAADDPALIRFGRSFFDSLPYSDVTYDDESAARFLALMRERGVLLLAEADGFPVGMAGGLYAPFIFNDRLKVGQELFWWIEPEYRSLGIGRELLAELEISAKNAGCIRWSMIAIAGTQDQVGKLYDRAGYELAELTYTKRP